VDNFHPATANRQVQRQNNSDSIGLIPKTRDITKLILPAHAHSVNAGLPS
jgi:hypothetical protein